MQDYPFDLQPTCTHGAEISVTDDGAWRLQIPAGLAGKYRLSQLDNYSRLPRRQFPSTAPVRLSLRARASAQVIPGTWGFGLWNDPFGMAIVSGVERIRLPALPNAAWFFYGAPPNHLSLRGDIPADGWMASTFRSPRWPAPTLALGLPALPLLIFGAGVNLLRSIGRIFLRQDGINIPIDPMEWHHYSLQWKDREVDFSLDGESLLKTKVAPQGRLGLVIWVDNQYWALAPGSRARFGTLENKEPAWIEIADMHLEGAAA